MSLEGLIAVEKLAPDLPSLAAAGSLLVPYGGNGNGLLLRFDTDRARLGLQIDARHQRAFQGIDVDAEHEPAIVLQGWMLWVDPESAYNTFQDRPEQGNAFITKIGHTGFVCKIGFSTAYVTIGGEMINQPDWGKDLFVGFRRWTVGYLDGDRRVNLLPLQDL